MWNRSRSWRAATPRPGAAMIRRASRPTIARAGRSRVNGGEPAGIAEVAAAFITAFPDIEVFMDELVVRDDGVVEYRWTFTGTSAETGRWVRIPGFEEWTIDADGAIAESRGHFDQAEYDRQLREGAGA